MSDTFHTFADESVEEFPFLFLVKSFNRHEMYREYIEKTGMDPQLCAFKEVYSDPTRKKTRPSDIRAYCSEALSPFVKEIGAEFLLIADGDYFKVLTSSKKVEPNLGYVKRLIGFPGYGTYIPPIQKIFTDPDSIRDKIEHSVNQIINYSVGSYVPPGYGILRLIDSTSLDSLEIYSYLEKLISTEERAVYVDIETTSLKHYSSEVVTISFTKHSTGRAVSFSVGDLELTLLKQFFKNYQGEVIWHNATFDVYILVYHLFMDDLLDQEGMLEGISVLTKNIHDTKIIAYLAINSCSGNELSLKTLAQPFTGNYELDDIKDVLSIPRPKLLEYNCVDTLATKYVMDTYYPKMVKDNQLEIYNTIFIPALKDIIQMQLTGMPLNIKRVEEVDSELKALRDESLKRIYSSDIIKDFTDDLAQQWVEDRNAKLVKKRVAKKDFTGEFNPNSSTQLQSLLFNMLQFDVIDKTPTGLPKTSKDVLEALQNHTSSHEIIDLLQAIVDFTAVDKIISTFMPPMLNAVAAGDGWNYLFGNFNLGGTVSGRLSSCLAPWSLVKTKRGHIPISEIKIGDEVWTHKRRWKPVLDVIEKGVHPTVNVKLNSGAVITCTKAHRLHTLTQGFKSVQEILDERIKEVDSESRERTGSVPTISSEGSNPNSNRYSSADGNHTAQCRVCFKDTHSPNRVQSSTEGEVFSFQAGRKESNERQDKRVPSQLHRRSGRWLWLQNCIDRWKAHLQSQSDNGQSIRNKLTSSLTSCPPHRWGSTEQFSREPSTLYGSRTQNDPLSPEDKCYREIQEIYVGRDLSIWDLTVADDHSYFAVDCFHHNSNPNLQNLPSGSKYGELVKSCFQAPPGWAYVGLDFNSLEDMISALTTKDPNKLDEYIKGYDGHSLRSWAYFKEDIEGIDPTSVSSINSIKTKYKSIREESKPITFALTYLGTIFTLMKNCGMSKEKAQMVYDRYHRLYKVSTAWVQDKLDKASKDGYVIGAFGLKVRTPYLSQTVRGTNRTPKKAEAEGRTAGNALGQSWGLLNTRAATEFLEKVRESEHRLDIRPCSHIHDAQYYLVRDQLETLTYVNRHLVKAVRWQEAPEIQHDQVKLGGNLSVFHPDWSNEIEIPNDAFDEDIRKVVHSALADT